eukprot:GGOE01023878.1.p1 GENE.GGOE01023878.1~~GGOE01023878.1.p1  ORF type:complete len:513 (-),score=178.47 GGOE01023878.1:530-1996(-)
MADAKVTMPTGAVQKALELNLDNCSYGTIAEIGAGQEVARMFFRAGGAAGTVAKTMSAYDMKVSDSVYGEGTRYVSLERLQRMLKVEYELLCDRLAAHRVPSTQFFAFADTMAAKSFSGKGDCHGWMGCRLQLYPHAEPSDILLHVRMFDQSADAQQDAVGILGVNLIYGAYNYWKNPKKLLESLKDNLFDDCVRINVDLVKMSGPCWSSLDHRVLNTNLLLLGLTPSVMFGCNGEEELPSDVFYKKSALVVRGHFRPVTKVSLDMVTAGMKAFLESHAEEQLTEKEIVVVAEMSIASLMSNQRSRVGEELRCLSTDVDMDDLLGRADTLRVLGCHVMVTAFGEFYRFRQYVNNFTKRQIGIVISSKNLHDIFNESFYESMEGGLLEAFGKLFTGDTGLYVYPFQERDGTVENADNVLLPVNLRHLYQHLKYNKFIIGIEPCNPDLSGTYAEDILKALQRGNGVWENSLPEGVCSIIKSKRLFGYASM